MDEGSCHAPMFFLKKIIQKIALLIQGQCPFKNCSLSNVIKRVVTHVFNHDLVKGTKKAKHFLWRLDAGTRAMSKEMFSDEELEAILPHNIGLMASLWLFV